MLADNETVLLYSASRILSDDEENSLNGIVLNIKHQNLTYFTTRDKSHSKIESAALSGPHLYFVVHRSQEPPSSVLVQSYINGSYISNMTFDYGKLDNELRTRGMYSASIYY